MSARGLGSRGEEGGGGFGGLPRGKRESAQEEGLLGGRGSGAAGSGTFGRVSWAPRRGKRKGCGERRAGRVRRVQGGMRCERYARGGGERGRGGERRASAEEGGLVVGTGTSWPRYGWWAPPPWVVGGVLANLPTFRLVDLSTFRLVGKLVGQGGGVRKVRACGCDEEERAPGGVAAGVGRLGRATGGG